MAWGTANVTREFLYVEDAAEAIVLAAERYEKPEPVNLVLALSLSLLMPKG
ncbi:MAG TPA: NAD-dependent epimerase/dehydratase family protein [Candidatus Acidoferrales bacterium]|nr:NAD-dependent epimerase/dehydratase family protein [Candidatus Acidoferrales bacterium]